MPVDQAGEFNRYIGLMNGINQDLLPFVVQLEAQVEIVSLMLGWLTTCVLWQVNAEELASFIEFDTTEPVTESEYRELERTAREKSRPIDELAELLVERHEGFTDADLSPEQPDDPHYGVIVMPESWERVRAEKRAEVEWFDAGLAVHKMSSRQLMAQARA